MPVVKELEETQIITVDSEKLNVISKARQLDGDIGSFESRIKTLKEQVQEEIENSDEFVEVQRLTEELKTAKEKLKQSLNYNKTYVGLAEDLAEEKEALKDAKYSLSEFLLAYFAETKERQIEFAPNQAREVIMKSRLGKPKDYQTSIFTADKDSEQ